jgi:hypothetical protein
MTPTQHALLKELIALSGGDALFRPSSADRLIGCPGSIVLNARLPKVKKRSTAAQREGTAAHKVAEDALNGVRQPDEWTDRMVRIDSEGMEGEFVTEEMTEGVQIYLDTIASREEPGTERFVERKLSLAPLDPTDPMLAENRGTGDCVIVNRRLRKLTIVDLKFGKGVMVKGDSPQLKDYALMALVSIGMDGGWSEVETIVVQPRAQGNSEKVKPVSFEPMDLLGSFVGELAGAMESALDPNAPLRIGSHCKWCDAKDVCPAQRDVNFNIARDAFARSPILSASSAALPPSGLLIGTVDHPRPQAPPGVSVLPSVLSFDPGELATILDRINLYYDAFTAAVKHRVAQLIQAGVTVPGWVMESRTGNRRWIDEKTAIDVLHREGGVKMTDIYTDPKLRSPAQIEKKLVKDRKHVLDALVECPAGEPTLIRASASKASAPELVVGRLGPIAQGGTSA